MANVNYKTLFALDTSASTSSVASYWNRVNEVYQKYKSRETLYVAWDANAKQLTEKQVETEISKKCTINGGDTRPDVLAKKIKDLDFKGKLVLITDGQISANNVKVTDQLLDTWDFEAVDIELIGTRIDLSVTAPFTRKTKFVIHHNGQQVSNGASDVEIDLKLYTTVEKFLEDYEKLYTLIVTQNMGKMNEGLRDALLVLQKQLLMICAQKNKEDIVGTPVLDCLKRGDYDAAITLTKKISSVTLGNADIPKEISDKIQKLVKACTNPGIYSLDILANARIQRADDTKQVESEQIEMLNTLDEKFECPIYYEQDIPALLVVKSNYGPILDGESKELVDLLCNCPLYLLTVPHLVEKLRNLIDHPVGCNSIAIKNGVFEDSPMTRKPILGAIPMGLDRSHVKAGNWTISRLFTGGKMIGNIQLWYAVIYHVVKNNVSYLADNKEFMLSMKDHLRYRMENYSSYMGLSGLPEYPLVKVPVGQAIWYCVASSDLYCEDNVEQDRLRSFNGISSILTGLLDELNYPYQVEFTKRRIHLVTAFGHMMNEKFTISKLQSIVRAQYQNHYYCKEKDTYVFLDGGIKDNVTPPALPSQFDSLSLSTVIYLLGKVSTQVKASQVVIPRQIPETSIPTPQHNYVYQKDTPNYKVLVCPATIRPYVIDLNKKVDWEISFNEHYGSLDKAISLNRHYLSYIQQKLQFPELDDFLIFVYNKESGSARKRETLPINILTTFKNVEQEFQEAFRELEKHLGRKLTIDDVLKRGNAAASKVIRHQIEIQWLNGTYEK